MHHSFTSVIIVITLSVLVLAYLALRSLEKSTGQEFELQKSIRLFRNFVGLTFILLAVAGTVMSFGSSPAEMLGKISSLMEKGPSPEELAEAKTLFESTCAPCHGAQGEGNIGPNLTDEYFIHGAAEEEVRNVIVKGVPEKGMAAWGDILVEADIDKLVTYIVTLRNTEPDSPKPPQGEKYALENGTWTLIPGEAITENVITVPDDIPDIPLGGDIKNGQTLFNGILGCAHCHGTNGHGHVDNRNVRGIQKRYGDDYLRMIDYVMIKGRPGTAMPPWEHLSEEKLSNIKSFLESIQQL